MQSGAFLNLVVTLTALVARLSHLSSTLRRVLSTFHVECLHLFVKIHVRVASDHSPCLLCMQSETDDDAFTLCVAHRSLTQLGITATATTIRRGGHKNHWPLAVGAQQAHARWRSGCICRPRRGGCPHPCDHAAAKIKTCTPHAARLPLTGARCDPCTCGRGTTARWAQENLVPMSLHTLIFYYYLSCRVVLVAAVDPAPQSSSLGPSSHRAVIVKSRARSSPSSPHTTVEATKEKRRNKKMRRDEIDDIFS